MGLATIGGNTSVGDPIAFPDQPFVVWVSTEGDDGTGEIGNPLLPFANPQAAANAIAAAASGIYTMRLGSGSFSGITFTATISERLRHIFGEGVDRSSLSIISNGAAGADGTPESISGQTGGDAPEIRLIGDNTVKISSITSTGGIGGTGAGSSDGENGGSGGPGGKHAAVYLESFHIGDITLTSGAGGNGTDGNSTSGMGGNGGDVATVRLRRCKFGTLTHAPGTGGNGTSGAGSTGSDNGSLEVIWCQYTSIVNDGSNGANSSAFILWSTYESTGGNAGNTDTYNIPA